MSIRNIARHKEELNRIATELGIRTLDDWYHVPATEARKKAPFSKKYGSFFSMLQTLYPHHKWDPLKLPAVPKGHWSDINSQREALEQFGRERFGVKELDDWYSVPATKVRELTFVHSIYNGLFNALKTLYPHHKWNPLKLSNHVPQRYWNDLNAQREALERFGREELGIKELDDWYGVSSSFACTKLRFIQSQYNSSLFRALKTLYPHHNWDPLKLKGRVPRGHWNDVDAQRAALEKFGREQLGIKELDDWYSVSILDVRSELSFIWNHYHSIFNTLQHLYPHHNWDPLRFARVPRGFWNDEKAQRDALERYGREKLGVKELDDWYSVPSSAVSGLPIIANLYQNSLAAALMKLYPEHDWDILRFKQLPFGYWKRPSTIEHYHNLFTQWKEQYNIREIKDWYALPPQQVQLFKRVSSGIFGSVPKMLNKWFPNTNWDESSNQIQLQFLLNHVLSENNVERRRIHSAYIPDYTHVLKHYVIINNKLVPTIKRTHNKRQSQYHATTDSNDENPKVVNNSIESVTSI